MQEVVIENIFKLRIFINGKPNLGQVPKEKKDNLLMSLEEMICEYYDIEKRQGITDDVI